MIIGFPHPPAGGGPGSFQIRIEDALKSKGWRVTYPEDDLVPDVILVVGGTRKLLWLLKHKRRNIPIVHRLDGLDWMHRYVTYPWGIKLKAELSNYLLRIIRNRIASIVVYQSEFIRDCWHRFAGPASCNEYIIYNATDCNTYRPGERTELKHLVCIEGAIVPSNAYLEPIDFLSRHLHDQGLISKTVVCGKTLDEQTRDRLSSCPSLTYRGYVARSDIPSILQNGVYLALEVNPPCPNVVMEALACGAPVIGFDTGSLRELVPPAAGVLVPYGGNPWKLETPDVEALAEAAKTVLKNWDVYSLGARKVAEERFDSNQMVNNYMRVFSKAIKEKEDIVAARS